MNFRALIVGTAAYELAKAPIPLLHRAGFEIDTIFLGEIDFGRYQVNRLPIKNNSLISTVAEIIGKYHYDLVILADDESISSILESNLPNEIKLKLLPVNSSVNFEHLASKCGISNVLWANKILTPPFCICNTLDDIEHAALEFGFPIFIKIDKSSGGGGVFECTSSKELAQASKTLPFPLLLQKKIEGKTVDLTAFYQKGRLIHFTYSIFLETIGGKYGPSSVREYTQNGILSEDVFSELQQLGSALGADGFVNATCIECSSTGKRYIFEADMRPNTWVDYGRFIGNDAAHSFFNYFAKGCVLGLPLLTEDDYPQKSVLVYPGRLSTWRLITNKYSCWKYFDSSYDFYRVVLSRIALSLINAKVKFLKSRTKTIAIYSLVFQLNWVNFKNIPYEADLRLRILCGKYLKPLLPPDFWVFFTAVYKVFKRQFR